MNIEDIEDFNIELKNVKDNIASLASKLNGKPGSMRVENDLLSAIESIDKAMQHSLYMEQ